MPVCPKCQFDGQDEESCERCGVIYARMHTIFDARPANLAELMKNGPPSRSKAEPTSKPKLEAPAIAHVAIPMPSRPPTPLRSVPSLVPAPDARTEMAVSPVGGGPPARSEVTMVPILPPPPEAQSRVPLLVGILVACVVAWGVLKIREARMEASGGSDVSVVEDADYYDLAVGSVVSDTQMQFRRVTDAEAARKLREEIFARSNRLRVELTEAPLTPAHRAGLSQALDLVEQFLKGEAEEAITKLTAEPTEPTTDDVALVVAKPGSGTVAAVAPPPATGATDQSLLKQANQLLATLPR